MKEDTESIAGALESLGEKMDILLRLACKLSGETVSGLALREKEMLTFREAVQYLGVSPSLLYKLTAAGEVPHYKPRGKMVYFSRTELEAFMRGETAEGQAKKMGGK